MNKYTQTSSRKGQAIAMILAVILVCVAFFSWIVGVHSFVVRKLRAQDGGDAVALAVARAQAMGLNLIGELNLIKAYMLAEPIEKSTLEDVETLTTLQERLLVTTIGHALAIGQAIATQNDLDPIPEAEEMMDIYVHELDFEGMYEGAREDFQAILEDFFEHTRENGGMRFLPLSQIYISTSKFSWLTNRSFYESILAEDKCWFWYNAFSFLVNYDGRASFGPLPKINATPIFDLKLSRKKTKVKDLLKETAVTVKESGDEHSVDVKTAFNEALETLGHPRIPRNLKKAEEKATTAVPWMIYDPSKWNEWTMMKDGSLLMRSKVKDQYDYRGCHAVVHVTKSGAAWVAAAKPFGTLNGKNPTSASYVLGGFSDVRLVPIDAAEPGIAGLDLEWVRHLSVHLDPYVKQGVTFDNCRYCRALIKWGQRSFRESIIDFLRYSHELCNRAGDGTLGSGGRPSGRPNESGSGTTSSFAH